MSVIFIPKTNKTFINLLVLFQRTTFQRFPRKKLQMVTLEKKNQRTVENSIINTDVLAMEIVRRSN